ncbi:hypothetical protein WJX81_006123 [Elliptochloris bilobata]|uniref:Thioredoxin-like fold domain-containing protein n=1 Tax=Elliptochloris bilobata TaxID=381761 RepID=A0AAW1S0B8_9CHLO
MALPVPTRELGHSIGAAGPSAVHLAAFLDYVCPYSCKFYKTMRREVLPHYKGKDLKFTFHHQVQPWHPQSTITHEAGLAVGKLGGEDAFWCFSDALYERQADFFDENVWGMTRPQVAAALAKIADSAAGVPAFELERMLGMQLVEVHGPNPGSYVTQDLKFAVKYARQLGVHVSPTTTLNGLVFDSNSAWGLHKWAGVLDPLLESALSRVDA